MTNFKTETFEEADEYDNHSDQQYNCGLHLTKELEIKQRSTVLDIGAGTGRLALHVAGLIGKDGSYFGIDLSPERINIAKKKAKELRASNLSFEIGDGTDLSRLKDGFFDAVYMNSVFHHIKDKKKVFDECHRVLKPGGRLGFTSQVTNIPSDNVREISKTILKNRGYNLGVSNHDNYSGTVDENSRRRYWHGIYYVSHYDNYPITVDEARRYLEQTGFIVQNIDVRQNRVNFASSEDVVNSIINRDNRNFLRDVPSKKHSEIRNELITEFKKIETKEGINFVNHKLYVIAEKKSN